MQGSLPQIWSWDGKVYVGLCGLAAVALCPDLADLKFTRSQITERRLHCPWLPLLGPPPPNTTFLLLDKTTRNVLMMNVEPREWKQRQRWSVPSEIRRRSENALNFFPCLWVPWSPLPGQLAHFPDECICKHILRQTCWQKPDLCLFSPKSP